MTTGLLLPSSSGFCPASSAAPSSTSSLTTSGKPSQPGSMALACPASSSSPPSSTPSPGKRGISGTSRDCLGLGKGERVRRAPVLQAVTRLSVCLSVPQDHGALLAHVRQDGDLLLHRGVVRSLVSWWGPSLGPTEGEKISLAPTNWISFSGFGSARGCTLPLSTKPSYPIDYNPSKLKLQVGDTLWWDSHGGEGGISLAPRCPDRGAALDPPHRRPGSCRLNLRELGPWASHMRWIIWIMASIGTVYVFFFHER